MFFYKTVLSPGAQYLANQGKLTDDFQKPLKGVPTVVLNNQYVPEENDMAQKDFAKALCKYIDEKLPACASGASTHMALITVLSLTLLLPKFL